MATTRKCTLLNGIEVRVYHDKTYNQVLLMFDSSANQTYYRQNYLVDQEKNYRVFGPREKNFFGEEHVNPKWITIYNLSEHLRAIERISSYLRQQIETGEPSLYSLFQEICPSTDLTDSEKKHAPDTTNETITPIPTTLAPADVLTSGNQSPAHEPAPVIPSPTLSPSLRQPASPLSFIHPSTTLTPTPFYKSLWFWGGLIIGALVGWGGAAYFLLTGKWAALATALSAGAGGAGGGAIHNKKQKHLRIKNESTHIPRTSSGRMPFLPGLSTDDEPAPREKPRSDPDPSQTSQYTPSASATHRPHRPSG